MDGNSHRTHGNDREQAGMSREGRRTMEKVRENTVHDKTRMNMNGAQLEDADASLARYVSYLFLIYNIP